MDKMELVEFLNDNAWGDYINSDKLAEEILKFFQSDPDAKWALREYREKRAEELIKKLIIKYQIFRPGTSFKLRTVINEHFELTEKEEKENNKVMCQKCKWLGMLCVEGDCHYEPKEEKKYSKDDVDDIIQFVEACGGIEKLRLKMQSIKTTPKQQPTIPKELTLHDCDWTWASKEVIKTINDCVKAIREIREK